MTPQTTVPLRTRYDRRIELAALVSTIVLSCSINYQRRFEAVSDYVSYVDVARTYLAGDWSNAINGYWGPLYSWLIIPVLGLFRPSAYWLYPALHAFHVIPVLGSFLSYRMLLEELLAFRATHRGAQRGLVLSDSSLRALGYVAFLWFTLSFFHNLGPDILISIAIYLATGLLLRISRGQHGPGSYAWLGLVCGLGYLAKAIFFPLSFVILVSAFLCRRPWRANWRNLAVAAFVFALVAGPFIAVLSVHKGRPTFGDSGRINLHRFLPLTDYKARVFTRFLPKRRQMPFRLDLVRGNLLAEHPTVYEFAAAPTITTALHYDPSNWPITAEARITPWTLVRSCALDALILGFLVAISATLFLPLIWLLSKTHWRPKSPPERLGYALALLPSVAGITMYLPILVNARYVTHFLLVILSILLTTVELSERPGHITLLARLSRFSLIGTIVAILALSAAWTIEARTPVNTCWNLAQAIQRQGQLQPGDRICILSESVVETWAQAGGFQISAEVLDRNEFWNASDQRREEIYALLQAAGVRAIVDRYMNGQPRAPGWQPIDNSPYGVLRLAEPPAK